MYQKTAYPSRLPAFGHSVKLRATSSLSSWREVNETKELAYREVAGWLGDFYGSPNKTKFKPFS